MRVGPCCCRVRCKQAPALVFHSARNSVCWAPCCAAATMVARPPGCRFTRNTAHTGAGLLLRACLRGVTVSGSNVTGCVASDGGGVAVEAAGQSTPLRLTMQVRRAWRPKGQRGVGWRGGAVAPWGKCPVCGSVGAASGPKCASGMVLMCVPKHQCSGEGDRLLYTLW